MYRHLGGLIAAPHTPMNADGSLNLNRVENLAASLIAAGCSGAFIGGTTGESASLTLEERMQLVERWRDVLGAKRPLQLAVHVGHTCQMDACTLARHAGRIGVDALAAVGPYFFKPARAEDLAAFLSPVAAAAGEVPFYYYHIPSMTGVTVKVYDLLNAAGSIANFAGAKFSFEDMMDFGRCIALGGGRYNMLLGQDQLLLAGLSLGARGAVGTTYNYAAKLFLRMMKAFDAGDWASARKAQAMVADFVAVIIKYGGIPASKAIMKMVGLDCGPLRLPLRDLSPAQYDHLRGDLEQAGFFEYACGAV